MDTKTIIINNPSEKTLKIARMLKKRKEENQNALRKQYGWDK